MNIPQKANVLIELREDGKIYVTGPLDQKQLCLAMIDEAKSIVNNWQRTSISIPTIKDLKKLNGNNL